MDNEKRERAFSRDNYRCVVCGRHAPSYHIQLAHRISNTKLNRKLYGNDIIDSVHNVMTVCSLQCNKSVDIGRIPSVMDAVADEIIKLI